MSAQAQLTKLPAPAAMLQMIQGFWVSRAICVAAELGIPDLLKDGPKKSDELAQAAGVSGDGLRMVWGCTVRRERACFPSRSVTHCFYGIGLWLGPSIVS